MTQLDIQCDRKQNHDLISYSIFRSQLREICVVLETVLNNHLVYFPQYIYIYGKNEAGIVQYLHGYVAWGQKLKHTHSTS